MQKLRPEGQKGQTAGHSESLVEPKRLPPNPSPFGALELKGPQDPFPDQREEMTEHSLLLSPPQSPP